MRTKETDSVPDAVPSKTFDSRVIGTVYHKGFEPHIYQALV